MNPLNASAPIVFDPSDPSFVEDPYPLYRRLRDERPAFYDEEKKLWLVTRYEDVARCLADYKTFSSSRGNAIRDLPQRVGRTLGSIDPPRHDELRHIIQPGLNNDKIQALTPLVRQEVRTRMAAFADTRQCDIVRDIGRPILYMIIGRMLGLEGEDSVRAAEMSAYIFHGIEDPMGPVMAQERFKEIYSFLADKTRDRDATRGDDVISALLNSKDSGAALSEDEIIANMTTVLLAGNASAGHFFSNLIHALWRHPDQRRMLLEDRSLLPQAIEEGVRWDTSTQSFARQCVTTAEQGGVTVPADSRMVLVYASANRDERAIEDPDSFNIKRKKVRHFGFGAGPHICAGAYSSRVLLHALMDELLPIIGEYEVDLAQSARVRHVQVRGFTKMLISW